MRQAKAWGLLAAVAVAVAVPGCGGATGTNTGGYGAGAAANTPDVDQAVGGSGVTPYDGTPTAAGRGSTTGGTGRDEGSAAATGGGNSGTMSR